MCEKCAAVFGALGYKVVTRQLASALAEVEANETMALATDFPKEG